MRLRRILPQPGWIEGRYLLIAASSAAEMEWYAFVQRYPKAAKRAFERLTSAPLDRQPRRQFPLRGSAFYPFWELEATGADRIWYAVDQAGLTVIVAARDDVHDSGRLGEMLKLRRVALEAAVNEVLRVAVKETVDSPLRVPEWALKGSK